MPPKNSDNKATETLPTAAPATPIPGYPGDTPAAPATAGEAATPATPAAAGEGAKESKARVAPELTAVRTDIPMPAETRGTKSIYPFDTLETVGASFGVKNKSASSLASIVSNQNRKGMEPKKDANGQTVYKMTKAKDSNGNDISVPTQEPEMVATKTYVVKDVDPKTDPEGATCRVWRTK